MEDSTMFWPMPGCQKSKTSFTRPSTRPLGNCRSQNIPSLVSISRVFCPVCGTLKIPLPQFYFVAILMNSQLSNLPNTISRSKRAQGQLSSLVQLEAYVVKPTFLSTRLPNTECVQADLFPDANLVFCADTKRS